MISIITPTYNRAALLPETIRSVLAQSYTNFEWIIADDGSTDDTQQVVEGFGDPRIKYFKMDHSGRLPYIRNFAISRSVGEYIAFLDSDDIWEPDLLKVLLGELEENAEAGFALAEALIFEGDQVPYPTIYQAVHKNKSPGKYFMELFTDKLFVIFPSTILMRRSAFEKAGLFDEKLRFGDKDMFTRLAWHFDGVISKKRLVRIRRHGMNMSSSAALGSLAEESFKEELHTLKEFFDEGYIEKGFWKKMSAVYYFKLAEFYYREGFFMEAGEAYQNSLRNNRWNPKALAKRIMSKFKK